MKQNIYDRAVKVGLYIIKTKSTVRQTAKYFGISKSTVFIDITDRLNKVNPNLYDKVRKITLFNKEDRHNRGGNSTKKKYMRLKEEAAIS